jgi:ABC-2 type transport system permease protein
MASSALEPSLLRPAQPVAPSVQALLFQRLRMRLLHNSLGSFVFATSIRLGTIVLLSVLIWAFLFIVAWYGYGFLRHQDLQFRMLIMDMVCTLILDLMFLVLAVMLVFSGGLILYGSLFNTAETNFLLCSPMRADQIFAYKFQSAMAFASWAFFLIASPVLIAYGVFFDAPWYFYALLPLYSLGFVLLPGSAGALGCLVIVRFVPRKRKQLFIQILVVLAVALIAWFVHLVRTAQTVHWTHDAAKEVLGQFGFAQSILAPTHWVTQGIIAARKGDVPQTSYRLALVLSNGLFAYVMTAWLAKILYRPGFNQMSTGAEAVGARGMLGLAADLFFRLLGMLGLGEPRHLFMLRLQTQKLLSHEVPTPATASVRKPALVDRMVSRALAFLDTQTRVLMMKDFRTFRRDPAQWAQVAIFLVPGLLYFANIRRFHTDSFTGDTLGRMYQNGVSMINLAATALLLCTYTGRFIYPMLSLEGRKFWILGLLPLQRDRLLWGKFAFSATWSLVVSEALILMSDTMLGVSWQILIIHAITIFLIALGLSGISVGLGATMANFRETDPSKIAVGMGGTLNLAAGLLFLLLEVLLMAGPWHLRLASQHVQASATFPIWASACMLLGVVVGVLAIAIPMRLGAQTLRSMEF